MSEADLANHTWWAWLWGEIEHWAFLLVVLFLAIEFAALKLGAPHKKALDDAKDIRIAELENETARLRKQMAPRRISSEMLTTDLQGVPPKKVEILFVRDVPDAFSLIMDFTGGLFKAGWHQTKQASPIEPPPSNSYLATAPLAMTVGGQPSGVSVVAKDLNNKSVDALLKAIAKQLGSAGGGREDDVPDDIVRIVIAPKP